jgi:hypothetical protein
LKKQQVKLNDAEVALKGLLDERQKVRGHYMLVARLPQVADQMLTRARPFAVLR